MIRTIVHCWQTTLRKAPQATALIDGASGRVWTRRGLHEAALAWRKSAVPADFGEGQRVLMAEPNGPDWFVVFLGLLFSDAVPIPADPTDPTGSLMDSARRLGAPWMWREGRFVQVAEGRAPSRKGKFCLVKLTSGSMGIPKACFFTHAQMIADGRQVCASMNIRSDDLNLGIIPFGHSYGLGNLVMPLLIQGTPVLCCTSPLPNALAQDCRKWKPSVFASVPTLLSALIRAEVEPTDLGSLRLVISAGAALPPETARVFRDKFGLKVHSFYGSSETGGITYDRSGEATLLGASVGSPMKGVRLVFKPRGRFQVISRAVMGCGKWSPPDRAKLNEKGELVLLGRQGRIVKIAGRRLDLSEVEAALRSLAGVRDAFVIPHPGKDDALAAVVASIVPTAVLKRLLRAKLAAWKIPERLLALEAFPNTARGKTDRRTLESLLSS